jgi:DNA gyrase subunit B
MVYTLKLKGDDNVAELDIKYDESSIEVLEGLEAVRKRPGMYIGSTGTKGLHHLVYEIVDNSIDEALQGFCDKIYTCINEDNSITVTDNGRGMPFGIHPKTGISTLTTILTVLHAGGKFSGKGYKVSGGLHGVGSSVVNALSMELIATVKRDGKKVMQKFCQGKPTTEVEITGKADIGDTGTTIYFKPDVEIFDTTEFNYNTLESRIRELAYLNKGVEIILEDKRDKKQQVKTFKYDGGIAEYIKYINKDNTAMHEDILYLEKEMDDVVVEVAMQYITDYNETIYSFANNINTHEGGTHETGFKTALTKIFNFYAREKGFLKDKDNNFQGEDIREGLVSIISIKLKDPQFEGQTKTKLGNTNIKPLVETVISDFVYAYLKEFPNVAEILINKMLKAQELREKVKNTKELARRKAELESMPLSGKLANCSSKNPEECEIYIVEGNSAGGSAKQGRNRRFQAILPLRGKILNVEKQMLERVLASEEIRAMIASFGAGIGKDFNVEKLRYHRIVIMTDADVDGAHIRTLLLTFFYRYMREMIEKGYVYIAQPPLYKISKSKKDYYAYSDKELAKLLETIGRNDASIQRYKGLGEMNPEQLWETTMNPQTRTLVRVNIENAMIADELFTILMGDKVEPRREFIQDNAKYVKNVDV